MAKKSSLTDLGLFNQRDPRCTIAGKYSTGIWDHSETRRKAKKEDEAAIISGHLFYTQERRETSELTDEVTKVIRKRISNHNSVLHIATRIVIRSHAIGATSLSVPSFLRTTPRDHVTLR